MSGVGQINLRKSDFDLFQTICKIEMDKYKVDVIHEMIVEYAITKGYVEPIIETKIIGYRVKDNA